MEPEFSPPAPPEEVLLSPDRSLPPKQSVISNTKRDYSLNKLFEAQDVLDKRYKVR